MKSLNLPCSMRTAVEQALELRGLLGQLGDRVVEDFNSGRGRDLRLADAADVSLIAAQIEQARLSLSQLELTGNLVIRKIAPYWKYRPLLQDDQVALLKKVGAPETLQILDRVLQIDDQLRQG